MQPGVSDSPAVFPQFHLPLFTHEEIQAHEKHELSKAKRAEAARKRYLVSIKRKQLNVQLETLFDQIDDRMLASPLGGPQEGNELDDPVELQLESDSTHEDQTETSEWSDDAVAQLHESVLHYSLMLLQSRGNEREKKEVLKWIFAPVTLVATISDPEQGLHDVILSQTETPFSYERCCRLCGYDPDFMQQLLEAVLKERGLGNIFNEISNG